MTTTYRIDLYPSSADADMPLESVAIATTARTRRRAMAAAKLAAGRNARYVGDRLSIRYAGDAGTAYVVER